SAPDDLHGVAVRVACQCTAAKSQVSAGQRDHPRRDERRACRPQSAGCVVYGRREQPRLPVSQVICTEVCGEGAAVSRAQVLQEVEGGAAGGAQTGDPQVGTGHVVQVLLLGAVVLATASHLEAQQVTIELEARLGIADDDGGVVNAQEEPVLRLPLRETL